MRENIILFFNLDKKYYTVLISFVSHAFLCNILWFTFFFLTSVFYLFYSLFFHFLYLFIFNTFKLLIFQFLHCMRNL